MAHGPAGHLLLPIFVPPTAGGGGSTGTIAVTQDDQTLAAAGNQTHVGTSSWTQADQTLAAAGNQTHVGTSSWTQDDQTFAASGSIGSAADGTIAVTQDDQTFAAAGNQTHTGTSSWTQDAQTFAAAGAQTHVGTSAWTQDDQTFAASGTAGNDVGAWTQDDQTLAAAGTAPAVGTAAVVQADQTIASSGSTSVTGTSAVIQDAQTFTAAGTVPSDGTIAWTQDAQTMNASGGGNFPDAHPVTVTIRETGHRCTVRAHQRGATVVTPGYATLSGVAGNSLSSPDDPSLEFNNDITTVARIRLASWTPAENQYIAARSHVWRFVFAAPSNRLYLGTWSAAAIESTAFCSAALPAPGVDGWLWVAATRDLDDGAGNRVTRFWTGYDGMTWAQLGTTGSSVGVATIATNTSSALLIGTLVDGPGSYVGDIGHVSVRNGIGPAGAVGGTEVFRFDGYELTNGAAINSFTSASGHTVTINRSGSPSTTVTPLAIDGPSIRITVRGEHR